MRNRLFAVLVMLVSSAAGDAGNTASSSQHAVGKLIRQLDDDDFHVREAATGRLIQLGDRAIPAVTKALKSESAEVRSRAARVLAVLRRMGAIQCVFNDAYLGYDNSHAQPGAEQPLKTLRFTERQEVGWQITQTKRGHLIRVRDGACRGWYLECDDAGRTFRDAHLHCVRNLQLSKKLTPRASWRLTKTEDGFLIQARAGRFKDWHLDIELETGGILLTKQLVGGAYWKINHIERKKPPGMK